MQWHLRSVLPWHDALFFVAEKDTVCYINREKFRLVFIIFVYGLVPQALLFHCLLSGQSKCWLRYLTLKEGENLFCILFKKSLKKFCWRWQDDFVDTPLLVPRGKFYIQLLSVSMFILIGIAGQVKMAVDKMVIDKMVVDKMVVDKMVVDKMVIDKMVVF